MTDRNDIGVNGGTFDITREEFGYAPLDSGLPTTTWTRVDPTPTETSTATPPASVAATPIPVPNGPPKPNSNPKQPKPPFKLYSIGELLDMPTPKSVVRRVLRLEQLALIFGEPGSYKTFVILDLVLKVCTGLLWWGSPTLQGSVIYFAGEGIGGLRRRIQAWAIEHGFEACDLAMRVLPHSVPFDSDDDFARLIQALKALANMPLIVVIDTLARFGGALDENSASEMGVFIDRCDEIKRVTGAAVVVVHHTRKGSRVLRGSSALEGAADVVIEVLKPEKGKAEVTGRKSKDDEAFPTIYLNTATIPLGVDEDGEFVSSLVLRPGEAPEDEGEVGSERSALQPLPVDEPAPDPALRIRETLAQLFHGEASGNALLKASGVKSSTFYDTLKREIRECRIEAFGKRPRLTYRLTPEAPEYVTPTPTPENLPESEPESGALSPLRSNSDSGGGIPLSKGVPPEPESESREGENSILHLDGQVDQEQRANPAMAADAAALAPSEPDAATWARELDSREDPA